MELIVNFATSFTNLITLNMKSDIEIARSVELKEGQQEEVMPMYFRWKRLICILPVIFMPSLRLTI